MLYNFLHPDLQETQFPVWETRVRACLWEASRENRRRAALHGRSVAVGGIFCAESGPRSPAPAFYQYWGFSDKKQNPSPCGSWRCPVVFPSSLSLGEVST